MGKIVVFVLVLMGLGLLMWSRKRGHKELKPEVSKDVEADASQPRKMPRKVMREASGIVEAMTSRRGEPHRPLCQRGTIDPRDNCP